MFPRFSRRSVRGTVHTFLALCLAASACTSPLVSSGTPTSINTEATPTPINTEARLPKPPAPLAVPAGTPEEQAVALANAVGPESLNRLAGWLAVYQALGIPILANDGSPIGTGDDPIGPPYWQVWYVTGWGNPKYGFPLTDFAKIFSAAGEAPFDSQRAAEALLEDLRSAAVSEDPQVKLFGLFVAEMVKRGPRQADLLDPAVKAEQVVVTGEVAELLSWVIIRSLVFNLEKTSSTGRLPRADGTGVGKAQLAQPIAWNERAISSLPRVQRTGQIPCSEMMGDEDVTRWFGWILGKLEGGFRLPGMLDATPGIIELIQEYLGAPETTIEKTQKVLNAVNALAALLTLWMQLEALTISSYMEPDPLERTKTTTDGKEATIYLALISDPDAVPDGNDLFACAASFLLNALGTTFSFPASGRVAGAEVVFEPGTGFGETVLIDYKSTPLRQDTDANGEVTLRVLGKTQSTEIPDDADPVMREFSLHISAQPEATTGNTIFNTFFESLSFWAKPSASGLISAVVEILKTFHVDLGERIFRLQDWSVFQYALRIEYNYQMDTSSQGFNIQDRETAVIEIPLVRDDTGAVSGEGTIAVDRTAGFTGPFSCTATEEHYVGMTIEGSSDKEAGLLSLQVTFASQRLESHGIVCNVPGLGAPPGLLPPGQMSHLDGRYSLSFLAQEGETQLYQNGGLTIIFTLVRPTGQ